jgi:hypothetical protein
MLHSFYLKIDEFIFHERHAAVRHNSTECIEATTTRNIFVLFVLLTIKILLKIPEKYCIYSAINSNYKLAGYY